MLVEIDTSFSLLKCDRDGFMGKKGVGFKVEPMLGGRYNLILGGVKVEI